MQVARTYSPRKVSTVQKIETLAKKYGCIAASRLHKVRAAQLLAIRRNFRGQLEILVTKNRFARIALSRTSLKQIDEFAKNLEGQSAFIFSNIDPFKLFVTLEKNRVNLPARAGDVATDDVVIPAGNTGLPPGPVLSEFKEARVPTRIDTGSIWVSKDTVVATKGEQISPKLAGLLARLAIRPIRAGLSVFMAYWGGLVLYEKDIKLDLEAITREVIEAHRGGFALALKASYPTRETATPLILRGHASAMALVTALGASGYLTKENVARVLAGAAAQAEIVFELAKQKGYT